MPIPAHPPGCSAPALSGIGRAGNNNDTREALKVREAYTAYFHQAGAGAWQDRVLQAVTSTEQTKVLLRGVHRLCEKKLS